jgi:glycosyltransferase 2 family protein
MKKLLKNKYVFVIKIILALAILFFIFKRIDYHSVLKNFSMVKASTMIILILIAILKVVIQIINWGKYLRINPEYKPQTKEIISSFLIGDALRFVVPGGYGTLGKMYFVNNHKKDTFISMGVEKFLQIWSTLSFAAFASIFYFDEINLAIKIAVTAFIWFSPFLLSIISSIPKFHKIHKYSIQYNKYIPAILGRQVVYMLLTITQYYVIMTNFLSVNFWNVFVAVPLILSANILPITYAGLGLRETFAIKVLQKFGIKASISITCSLIIFAVNNILPALVGVYFIIARKNQERVLPDKSNPSLTK